MEKQQIEDNVAREFLSLYNPQMGSNFEIIEIRDTPDVFCKDSQSGTELFLEITLIEDLPGYIKYLKGKGEKPKSPSTRSTAISFFDDSVQQLRSSVKDKLLSKYGKNTALVIKQVSILWEKSDWEMVADKVRSDLLDGQEENYGAGVWIICTDNTTWPARNDLFILKKPVNSP